MNHPASVSPAPPGLPLRVVLIGPECTGKTTLAKELARWYGVPWVPEFARAFVESVRRPVRFDDVDAIARGQQAGEDQALLTVRGRLLVLDTDLVSTWVYSRHYYGDCPPWVAPAARARRADLYLLLATDVPWIAEGDQREQPERREELFRLFRSTLGQISAPVTELRGSWPERRALAVAAVDRLLASAAAGRAAPP
jgi:NadR type nicotinamide-nucleotide adenylyltransferase